MDLKINREMLPVTEVILDEMQEQSVELDYVLPDYDPGQSAHGGWKCVATVHGTAGHPQHPERGVERTCHG